MTNVQGTERRVTLTFLETEAECIADLLERTRRAVPIALAAEIRVQIEENLAAQDRAEAEACYAPHVRFCPACEDALSLSLNRRTLECVCGHREEV